MTAGTYNGNNGDSFGASADLGNASTNQTNTVAATGGVGNSDFFSTTGSQSMVRSRYAAEIKAEDITPETEAAREFLEQQEKTLHPCGWPLQPLHNRSQPEISIEPGAEASPQQYASPLSFIFIHRNHKE